MKTKSKTSAISGMAVNLIGGIVLLLAAFGVIAGVIGFVSFTSAMKKEYDSTTYHMADTAATVVNGDHIGAYLEGRETEEYARTKSELGIFCKKLHVSLIYVIAVDQSDYGRFVSVFNLVDNSVDNSTYVPWEPGFERDTTNDEYRRNYEALYTNRVRFAAVYRTRPGNGYHPHITTMVPVKDSAGRTTAILCIQRPIRELNEARRPYVVQIAVSTFLLALLSSLFAAFFIQKRVVTPIRRVSNEAARFAGENRLAEPLGENISRFSEISNLALSIDKMEREIVSYVDNLTAVTAEKERIGTELSLASRIQEGSVPNVFPAFPDRRDFDVYASMTPAKEVGGDFYNFFLTGEDRFVLMIGDVSGKGIPGALFMMASSIFLSSRAKMGGRPSEILAEFNDEICRHNDAEMFVTLWLGILDLKTGLLTFANAGHEDAALCRKDGEFDLWRTKHSLVAGAMPGVPFRDFEMKLENGDKLFLYTDGVPEATDAENRMFGLSRMVDTLNGHRAGSPSEILEGMRESVNAFVGGAPQFDDLTMVCLRYDGE
ncbi:MAG: PP2C family protein-serine/threonine phosphatase [Clostridia bacterium]|nr:PP2C family protein-serine/threonine phosphatase [Clostridia bacterium]